MTLHYAPQRDGVRDCLIAAAATVLDMPYEDMAGLLGYPVDEEGIPTNLPPANGISFLELTAPLLRVGVTTTIVMTAQTFSALSPASRRHMPSEDDLKALLQGRRGILTVFDQDSKNFHALAYKDGQVIDCRATNPLANQLDDITVIACALLEQSKEARQ